MNILFTCYILSYSRWRLLQHNLDNYRLEYIKNLNMKEKVSYLKLEADVHQRYAGSEWLTITLNLMSAILVGANFNSKAADVSCSIFNLAQTLADIENSILIDDCLGKIKCPFAKPLLVGNKEEDNVFIEYVSALVNTPTHSLNTTSFLEGEYGLFVDKLFEQVTDEGVPIPRPMKSCCPDWVLSYRGCPLAYGEGQTSQGDTTEGLQYTNLCATNI